MNRELAGNSVPRRALAISVGALIVPVLGAFLLENRLGAYAALLWLSALVPAFLLAYYRGWRGVATSLALGMAVLSLTQVGTLLVGRDLPDLLFGVVIAYVAISLGIGGLADSLHQDRAEVEDMAFTDLLTKLPNRRHARLFLENEFAAAERGRPLSLVLFDLDHFKRYNDEHGHAAGDRALALFGEILERTTRRMDLSARFGGEEFVSVLTASDTEGALIFADRIRRAVAQSHSDGASQLTVSAGVATYHPSMRSPDELLASADHALYQAKHEGRNRVRLFGHALMDPAIPSPEDAVHLRASLGKDASEYPRPADDIGRTKPSLTLLPHQITGFGKGRSALVVEDDPQVRGLVDNYLSLEGFEVHSAIDVRSGIDSLNEEYDVVVTDLRMPGAYGIDLIRAVKSRWPLTEVIVITGLQDAEVAAEALAAGADRYLFKPFGMPDLRARMIDSLEQRDRRAGYRASSRKLAGDARVRAERARGAIRDAMDALVRAMEARAPDMRGRANRLPAYASTIAERLDVGVDMDGLRLGCRLLDVGKVAMPDDVLNKDGPLEPDERKLMKTHTAAGRRVLESLLDDETALSVVSWHHECWDGSGYPDGLSGSGIPLAARIVAVCDALDAMTSDRAYRAARPWEEAVDELRDLGGTRYDPAVIEALNGCLSDLRAVFEAERGDA